MSRGAAAATFNSCNKAGSIPHFTNYLRSNPNDYEALLWRGHAHSIVGDTANSIEDYKRAASVVGDPEKTITLAFIEKNTGNVLGYLQMVRQMFRQYPNSGYAAYEYGTIVKDPGEACIIIGDGIQKAKQQGKQHELWIPWAYKNKGDLHYNMLQTDEAKSCYNDAIQCSPTMTVAHIGLARCYVVQEQFLAGKESFEKAKELNPSIVGWADFSDFRKDVKDKNQARVWEYRNASGADSGRRRGGRGGGGGRGSGSGSGSDSDDSEDDERGSEKTPLQIVKKNARKIGKYRGLIFFQSREDPTMWYSPDKAGHGGSVAKLYRGRNTIRFECSVDKDLNPMHGKHESTKFPEIRINDMDFIK